MENKRYSILGSLIDSIKTFVKGGRDETITEKSNKLDSKSKAFVEKLLKKRDTFVSQLVSSLNGGGTSSNMNLAVELSERQESKPDNKPEQEKSDGFEREE